MKLFLVVAALIFGASAMQLQRGMPHIHQVHSMSNDVRPSSADCRWEYFDQTLDHFVGTVQPSHSNTFKQRYCIIDKFWKAPSDELAGNNDEQPTGPIFFYTGNESPVEEYINNTGLLWELAPQFGALIVFFEHRYEGESVPPLVNTASCLSFCSSTQAIADYAAAISSLKISLRAESSPVIAFGGSYGGMLAAYLRFKYPNLVAGAISASAPIWGVPMATSDTGLDGGGIAISRGVSAKGGATDMCYNNLKFAWPLIRAIGDSDAGRELLSNSFRLCSPLTNSAAVDTLVSFLTSPFFNLAEGNYPFASTYITFAVGPGLYPLPPWPLRVACEPLNTDFGLSAKGAVENVSYSLSFGSQLELNVDWDRVSHSPFSAEELRASNVSAYLEAVRDAVAVWYNVTGDAKCFSGVPPPSDTASNNNKIEKEVLHVNSAKDVCTTSEKGSWGPLCCNDNLNLVNYVTMGVGHDIFWPPTVARGTTVADIVNRPGTTTGCASYYAQMGLFGVPDSADPWSRWFTAFFGGRAIRSHSNIVFSNGLMDPWSSAGVYGPEGYAAAVAKADASQGNVVVQNVTADGSILAVVMGSGGHHLDLFFSTPEDPICAVQARQIEAEQIGKWIKEYYEEREWQF